MANVGPYQSSYGSGGMNPYTGWQSGGQAGQSTQSQSPMRTSFYGRYISDFSEILPNETPMDGSVTLFPNKDLSEIFLRTWNQNGSLMSFRYVLDTTTDLNAPVSPPQQQDYQTLMDRITDLENMVRRQRNGRNSSKGEEAKQ